MSYLGFDQTSHPTLLILVIRHFCFRSILPRCQLNGRPNIQSELQACRGEFGMVFICNHYAHRYCVIICTSKKTLKLWVGFGGKNVTPGGVSILTRSCPTIYICRTFDETDDAFQPIFLLSIDTRYGIVLFMTRLFLSFSSYSALLPDISARVATGKAMKSH